MPKQLTAKMGRNYRQPTRDSFAANCYFFLLHALVSSRLIVCNALTSARSCSLNLVVGPPVIASTNLVLPTTPLNFTNWFSAQPSCANLFLMDCSLLNVTNIDSLRHDGVSPKNE